MVEDKEGEEYLIIVHRGLCDKSSSQNESMLNPHQARAHSVIVDDLPTFWEHANGNPGLQALQMPDGIQFPLTFDGTKSFLSIRYPSDEDLDRLTRYEVTSPAPYKPCTLVSHRRSRRITLEEWQRNLGYIHCAVDTAVA